MILFYLVRGPPPQSELKNQIGGENMKGNHPKRRKDKYNPYIIFEMNGKYYIEFKDGQKKNTA